MSYILPSSLRPAVDGECVFAPEPLCAAGAEDKDELVRAHPSLTHAIRYCILRLKQPNCCFSLYVCRSMSNLISIGPHRRGYLERISAFLFYSAPLFIWRFYTPRGSVVHWNWFLQALWVLELSWTNSSCTFIPWDGYYPRRRKWFRHVTFLLIMQACMAAHEWQIKISGSLATVFQSDIPSLFRWH